MSAHEPPPADPPPAAHSVQGGGGAVTPVPQQRRRVGALAAIGGVLALVVGLGWAESAGWPFLAQPLAHWLSGRLDREVRISSAPGFALHLWGGVHLKVQSLQVANPAWSSLGDMVQASGAELRLSYRDLWRHQAGQPLPLQIVQAEALDLRLDRDAQGRASWQLGKPVAQAAEGPAPAAHIDGLRVGRLAVGQGRWQLRDAQNALLLTGKFQIDEGPGLPAIPGSTPVPSSASASASASTPPVKLAGLNATGQGQWRGQALTLALRTGSTAPWRDAVSDALPKPQADAESSVAVQLQVDSGRSALRFDGSLADPTGQPRLNGKYTLRGPSLADLGRPVGITLPTTRAVALQGRLAHQGDLWHTVIDSATVGRSQLAGALQLQRSPGQPPQLDGRVTGKVLWLEDLGPAIGVPVDAAAKPQRPGRVLPDRPFDLPSLRAMNARVLLALDRLESGSARLRAVAPLSAQITLRDGLLQVGDIDARLAQGRIRGLVQLDGRSSPALWLTDLRAQGLDLADWISQPRAGGLPPYVSGRLAARLRLTGQGQSTAQLLASADGQLAAQWTRGKISHLVVEAAGIDIAQALGVYLQGDEALPVTCGAADVQISKGVARPKVLVVDTPDSMLWAEGSASLVDESLNLMLHVSPKDVSPLALRTPVRVGGSFDAPSLTLDKAGLARRLLPAVALALVAPLAGLLPLVDVGEGDAPSELGQACQNLLVRRLPAPRL